MCWDLHQPVIILLTRLILKSMFTHLSRTNQKISGWLFMLMCGWNKSTQPRSNEPAVKYSIFIWWNTQRVNLLEGRGGVYSQPFVCANVIFRFKNLTMRLLQHTVVSAMRHQLTNKLSMKTWLRIGGTFGWQGERAGRRNALMPTPLT